MEIIRGRLPPSTCNLYMDVYVHVYTHINTHTQATYRHTCVHMHTHMHLKLLLKEGQRNLQGFEDPQVHEDWQKDQAKEILCHEENQDSENC